MKIRRLRRISQRIGTQCHLKLSLQALQWCASRLLNHSQRGRYKSHALFTHTHTHTDKTNSPLSRLGVPPSLPHVPLVSLSVVTPRCFHSGLAWTHGDLAEKPLPPRCTADWPHCGTSTRSICPRSLPEPFRTFAAFVQIFYSLIHPSFHL